MTLSTLAPTPTPTAESRIADLLDRVARVHPTAGAGARRARGVARGLAGSASAHSPGSRAVSRRAGTRSSSRSPLRQTNCAPSSTSSRRKPIVAPRSTGPTRSHGASDRLGSPKRRPSSYGGTSTRSPFGSARGSAAAHRRLEHPQAVRRGGLRPRARTRAHRGPRARRVARARRGGPRSLHRHRTRQQAPLSSSTRGRTSSMETCSAFWPREQACPTSPTGSRPRPSGPTTPAPGATTA